MENTTIERKNNAFFTFFALTVAVLIPVPGRLAFGIIMLLLFNLLILTGMLFTYAIYRLELEAMKTPILTVFLLCITMLFKTILNFACPILCLSLSFVIYLPAASTALISYFFDNFNKNNEDIQEYVTDNMKEALAFSIFALIIFIFRDIFGYGTLTFPAKNGFALLNLPFSSAEFSAASFLATIPGAFILVSVLFALLVFAMNKIHNIERIIK